jgi:heme-degrading monooxygenase HmoA
MAAMTVIKINAITVPEGMGDEVARRFGARAGAVDGTPGFEGFELLRPEDDRNQWLVVTRWVDDESFEAWRGSESAMAAHAHGGGAHGDSAAHRDSAAHGDRAHGDRAHGDGGQQPMGLTAELWSYSIAVSSDGEGGGGT